MCKPLSADVRKADEWVAILRLAHMWKITEIRTLAIVNLERSISLPAIQKVELTHEFDIQDWYMSAYKALVKRSGALSVEEATQLGFEFAIKMAGARERWILTSRIKPDNDFGQSNPEASLEADIIATFKIKPPSSQETVPQLFGAHRRPRKDCWGF